MFIVYYLVLLLQCGLYAVFTRLCPKKEEWLHWKNKEGAALLVFLLAASVIASHGQDRVEGLLYCILFAYLAVASYVDQLTKRVYRFFIYPALVSGMVYGFCFEGEIGPFLSLLLYAILLLSVFRRYFGWADVLAFLICGFFFLGHAESVLLCGLVHMGLSVLLVTGVNFKEMDWDAGKIKEPVAFLPYITVGMLCITGYWILQ